LHYRKMATSLFYILFYQFKAETNHRLVGRGLFAAEDDLVHLLEHDLLFDRDFVDHRAVAARVFKFDCAIGQAADRAMRARDHWCVDDDLAAYQKRTIFLF